MLVAKEIASFEEQSGLSFGDTAHRPASSDLSVNNYTKGTAVTLQDINSSDETLTINQSKEISFYVDAIDKKQMKYDAEVTYSQKAAYELSNDMDMNLLKETTNASFYMDAGDVGGSAGTAITVSASNATQVFSTLKALMQTQNIESYDPRCVVVTPLIASQIEQSVVTNGFNTADTALRNGYAGDFLGLKVYVSNNVLHSNVLTTSAIMVAAETVTIGGVVLTAKASGAAATAGDFSIGANQTACLTNLAALINNYNGTAGSTSTFIELSAANRAIFKRLNITATVVAGTIVITTNGKTSYAKASTVSTWGTQQANLLACKKGAIDMVIQMNPEVQRNKVADKSGYNYIILDLYGIKTFQEGKDRMYSVRCVA